MNKPSLGLTMLLTALTIVGPFSVDTYLPAFPSIAAGLGATPDQLQQTLSLYLAAFAFMTLWHGALADALGRRAVLLTSLALYAAASLFCALAPTIEMLLAGRILQGLSAGAGMVVSRAVIRDLYEGPEAHRLIAHVGMMFAAGPVAAPLAGGFILAFFEWHAIFVFLALLGVALFAAVWFALPETLPVERRQSLHPVSLGRAYLQVFSSPRFLGLAGAIAFNFGGLLVYVMSAPKFLIEHLGVSPQGFVWLFGPAMIGMLGGNYLSARLAGRTHTYRTVALGYMVMAAGAALNLALNVWTPAQLPWAVLPLSIYVFGVSLGVPVLSLSIMDLFPERRGLASSCQGAAQTAITAMVASVIAPLFWGSTLSLAVAMTLFLALGFVAFQLTQFRVVE
ncbi:MAG: multidrug effflux MFS transporter [Zoogloeaceae bacterium]|jgi:DHA1 family bicyclomycin/chloramphenicol resistance-like MFS transporter|nr:multidrug effflux MFS transporter [Zoogloeaceae bacterium]